MRPTIQILRSGGSTPRPMGNAVDSGILPPVTALPLVVALPLLEKHVPRGKQFLLGKWRETGDCPRLTMAKAVRLSRNPERP